MSKDIIVLTPNGRRQKIHCTPDTSILQVLEDVCRKQGFESAEYNLKHHNTILDLSMTIRFSNLPNKATLEMVESSHIRLETIVTIGLLLEDGERRTAEFSPNTNLFELVTSLAPNELHSLQHPTILYMRQEVTGLGALRDKTLKQLGLIKGRAILRLLNKAEEAKQANVSAVYSRPVVTKPTTPSATPEPTTPINETFNQQKTHTEDIATPGPSNVDRSVEIFKIINQGKQSSPTESHLNIKKSDEVKDTNDIERAKAVCFEVNESALDPSASSLSILSQENLERRLKIEEEVTFLGAKKAIAFMQPDSAAELDDLPDDFYNLSVEEVRRLYHELQQHRIELENSPLLPVSKRQETDKETSLQRLSAYKNVIVRVQFPDHIILQGIFVPSDTIQDVISFIREYLYNPGKPFQIFTTPLKETLDTKMTLLEARFVPCVHMHFRWMEDGATGPSLKEEIYSKTTPSDAARILASKYRAPCRRKEGNTGSASVSAGPSLEKNSSWPKWFRK